MDVKQISVFLENKSGRLAEVTKIFGENDIDISALSIADTTDFGILRLIVNDPEKAEKVLKENGFTVSSTNVIAIGVEDKPGGLSKALGNIRSPFHRDRVYVCFCWKKSDEALVLLRVEDCSKAVEVLTKAE